MTPTKPISASRDHTIERAAAKRMWLAQAEQFAAECGYFQVCPECGESAADRPSHEQPTTTKRASK